MLASAVVCMSTLAGPASADGDWSAFLGNSLAQGAYRGWYVMPGGSVSGSVALAGGGLGGLVGGGELSVVYYGFLNPIDPDDHETLWRRRPELWLGGYVDVVHQSSRDQLRVSMGPEFGWHAFGMDTGLVIAHDDHTHYGANVRALASLGVIQANTRLVVLPRDDQRPADIIIEFGASFKLPIWLGVDGYRNK